MVVQPAEGCGAALLRLQKAAVEHGLSLKDATAYNVAYDQGRPRWIDALSFRRLTPGKAWIAYRQFCQFFLAPLAVMSYVDVVLQAPPFAAGRHAA